MLNLPLQRNKTKQSKYCQYKFAKTLEDNYNQDLIKSKGGSSSFQYSFLRGEGGEVMFLQIEVCNFCVKLRKSRFLKRNSYSFPLRQNSRPRLAAPIAAGSG